MKTALRFFFVLFFLFACAASSASAAALAPRQDCIALTSECGTELDACVQAAVGQGIDAQCQCYSQILRCLGSCPYGSFQFGCESVCVNSPSACSGADGSSASRVTPFFSF